tara:strand:- start:38211 stop:38573 length:363 start_codon:yes stop_codon:yes gene_type:complete
MKMINTLKFNGHTPADTYAWSSLRLTGTVGLSHNEKEEASRGLTGCKINFDTPDIRWGVEDIDAALANQLLIMSAPDLLEQVEKLQHRIGEITDLCMEEIERKGAYDAPQIALDIMELIE